MKGNKSQEVGAPREQQVRDKINELEECISYLFDQIDIYLKRTEPVRLLQTESMVKEGITPREQMCEIELTLDDLANVVRCKSTDIHDAVEALRL